MDNPFTSRCLCQDHLGRIPMMLCGIDPQQKRDQVDQACGRIAKMLISAGAEVRHWARCLDAASALTPSFLRRR